jgi:hypothetical protein
MKRLIAAFICFVALTAVEAHATGYCRQTITSIDGKSVICTTCCFYGSCTTTCT